jgi:hypothetical protein
MFDFCNRFIIRSSNAIVTNLGSTKGNLQICVQEKTVGPLNEKTNGGLLLLNVIEATG